MNDEVTNENQEPQSPFDSGTGEAKDLASTEAEQPSTEDKTPEEKPPEEGQMTDPVEEPDQVVVVPAPEPLPDPMDRMSFNAGAFVLLSMWREREGTYKSTKAMQCGDLGCVVQTTTREGAEIAEALVFVPGAVIKTNRDAEGNTIGRELV